MRHLAAPDLRVCVPGWAFRYDSGLLHRRRHEGVWALYVPCMYPSRKRRTADSLEDQGKYGYTWVLLWERRPCRVPADELHQSNVGRLSDVRGRVRPISAAPLHHKELCTWSYARCLLGPYDLVNSQDFRRSYGKPGCTATITCGSRDLDELWCATIHLSLHFEAQTGSRDYENPEADPQAKKYSVKSVATSAQSNVMFISVVLLTLI